MSTNSADDSVGEAMPSATTDAVESRNIEGKRAQERDAYDTQITIGKFQGQLELIQNQIQNVDNTLDSIYAGIFAITLVIGLVFAHIIRSMNKKMGRMIGDAMKQLAGQQDLRLQTELGSLRTKIESTAQAETSEAISAVRDAYFKYARILSLVEIKKYDAALAAAGVTDIPQDAHKALPEEVQAALIKSLCRSRIRQGSNLAWQWMQELSKKRTKTALRCLLESASKISREDDALTLYDELSPSISNEERIELEPILLVLLRRSKNPEKHEEYNSRVKDIARRHENSEDISVIVNIAAIYRDRGLLDHADSILSAAMHKARDAMETSWDDAISRLLTTHIANCVDRNDPEKAVEAARLLFSRSNRPDQIFVCIRVAWRLHDGHEAREFFSTAILNRLKDGYLPNNDDGTWKSVALAHEILGKEDDCDQLINDQIARLLKKDTSSVIRQMIYFLRCFIAEIHIRRGTKEWLGSALAHLSPAREGDQRGEASFLMACAYGKLGDVKNVVVNLEHARAVGGNRWLSRAKSDPILFVIPEVSELHARSAVM